MSSKKVCRFCSKEFSRRLNCSLHENVCDENPSEIPRRTTVLQAGGGSDKFDLTTSSLDGAAREYKMYFEHERTQEWLVDLHDAMTRDTLDLLKDIKNKEGALFKWYFTLELTFHKLANPYIITDPPVYFHTRPFLLYMGDLLEHLQNQLKTLLEKIDKYEQNGSSWAVQQLISITVSLVKTESPLKQKANDD